MTDYKLDLRSVYNAKEEKNITMILKEYGNISAEQTRELLNVEYKGDSLLSLKRDPDFVYEIIGLLREVGFAKVLTFLKFVKTLPEINAKAILKNDIFAKERETYESDIFRLIDKVKVKESGMPCGHCGSKQTITQDKQLRAGDEAADYFIVCISCNHKTRL